MKYEINQLNDTDAVVISNEKIKHKDIVLHFTSNSILKADEFHESNGNVTLLFQDTLSKREVLIIECRKVIATISPYKIEGLPMLEFPERNITGYRLKPNIEKGMVNRVLNYSMPNWDDNDKSVYFIRGHVGGSLVAKLKELGVLNLWFTPIYDEDVKTWCKDHHLEYYYKEGLMAELSNQEKDVEKLAEHSSEVQEGTYTTQHKITYKHGFIDGYKAAQKQYSE